MRGSLPTSFLFAHYCRCWTRQVFARRHNSVVAITALVICCHFLTGCAGPALKQNSTPGSSNGSSTTSLPSPLTITPQHQSVRGGEVDKITASTEGGTWIVEGGASNGSIDSTGNYLAPPILPSNTAVSIAYQLAQQTVRTTITLLNPAPSLASLSPMTLRSATATVTVLGSGFMPMSTLLLNGTAMPTTYIDSGHLSAVVTVGDPLPDSLSVAVANPDPGASVSSSVAITVDLHSMTVTPAVLSGGNISVSVASPSLPGYVHITVNGREMTRIGAQPPNTTRSTGYLPPWQTGSAVVSLVNDQTGALYASTQVPIAPTAVPFDVAARFATQAAFGPRPDLIQHIQDVGLSAFVDEQLGQPPVTPLQPWATLRYLFNSAVDGNSLLRLRVALGLATFIPGEAGNGFIEGIPWEATLEADAFANYRKVLMDALADPNVASSLNLPGSIASTDPHVHPNQNFARELMQQFSMGSNLLNDDGTPALDASGNLIPNYDQTTVDEVSRMLTGWNFATPVNPDFTISGVDWSQPLVANESGHDTGAKTLFGSVHIPAGQTAEQDRASLVDAIVNQPSTAPFVSRLLIQRLVKSNPTPGYIKRIAAVFRDNGGGVSGDLAAVVKAILLDPEAREGDASPRSDDGILQDPLLFQLFVQNAIHLSNTDDEPAYVPRDLGENVWMPGSVFGYFRPGFMIPGTQINSPEFQIFTNPQVIGRSGALMWLLIAFNQNGTPPLETQSTTLPQLIDALNHIVYHGTMPQYEQDAITAYCSSIQDPHQRFLAAAFIALNSDNFSVIH